MERLGDVVSDSGMTMTKKFRLSVKDAKLLKAKAIWKDMVSEETDVTLLYEDRTQEKTQDKIITKQPKR